MANNQPCVTGTERACEALVKIIARALGYPKRGTVGPGATVQSTWNGIGNVPAGWVLRPTTTWYISPSSCAVPIPASMQAELAAAPAQARLTPADRASLNAGLAAIGTVNLDTYGSKCPGDKAYPNVVIPTFGIAWDGWGSDHARVKTNYLSTGDSPNNIWTDYPHRKPSGWASFDLWSFPGDPFIDPQPRADWRLQNLAGAISAISYDWYPGPRYFSGDPQNIPEAGYINYGLEAHRSSAYKNLVSIMIMIDPQWWSYNTGFPLPGNWGRAATYRADLIAMITDASYFRVLGRPVIGVYGYSAAGMDAAAQTAWLAEVDNINAACVAAIGVAPYWVVQDGNQTCATAMASKGARWKTTYGPNPSLPAYNANLPTAGALSQYPYSYGVDWDKSRWSSSGGGIPLAGCLTPNLDGRCRGNGSRAYVDAPTFLEFVDQINDLWSLHQVSIGKAEIASVYTVSEHSEGGSILQTDQDGTKYVDALKHANGTTPLTTYTENLSAHASNFVKTGAWTYVQQLGATYHDSDVMRSGATGSKLSLSTYRTTRYAAAFERGPNKGIANIYVDGIPVAAIDCYSDTPQAPAILWTSSVLTAGIHTLDVEESGTRNPSSSANGIGLDYVSVTTNLVFPQ